MACHDNARIERMDGVKCKWEYVARWRTRGLVEKMIQTIHSINMMVEVLKRSGEKEYKIMDREGMNPLSLTMRESVQGSRVHRDER